MKTIKAQAENLINDIHDDFVKRYKRGYVNELVRLKCGADLLAFGLFPNIKEVTESFAAYNAVRTHLRDWDLSDSSINVIVVGDGSTPRTAATFAFRSNWICRSVDPKMRLKPAWNGIKRLLPYRGRIEDYKFGCDKVIILHVHSHVKIETSLMHIKANKIAVVANPCCVPQEYGREPDIEYVDYGILSPKNIIKIWKSI